MSNEQENQSPAVKPADEAAPPAADGAEANETDIAELESPVVQLERVAAERDRLAAEADELRGQLLRRQADFDNFRRRVQREKDEFLEYAGMETVRALLPVLDDFERAVEAGRQGEPAGAGFVEGVRIIHQRLCDELKKLGLEPLESLGKPFDPNLHHAIETVPTNEADDHTVFEELQKGYNFKGKLLREAMVRVAVKPSEEN